MIQSGSRARQASSILAFIFSLLLFPSSYSHGKSEGPILMDPDTVSCYTSFHIPFFIHLLFRLAYSCLWMPIVACGSVFFDRTSHNKKAEGKKVKKHKKGSGVNGRR